MSIWPPKKCEQCFFPKQLFHLQQGFSNDDAQACFYFEGPKFHKHSNFFIVIILKSASDLERPKSSGIWSLANCQEKSKCFASCVDLCKQQQQFKSWGFCQVYKVLDNRAIGSWMKQQFEHEIKDLLSYSQIRGGSQAFWCFWYTKIPQSAVFSLVPKSADFEVSV